jgi:hypothetical protein
MPPRPLVRIFISYRRADTIDAAVHLQATLARRFGAEALLRDQTSLRPGQNFPRELEQAIQRSTTVIALMGRHWAGMTEEPRRTRLENPKEVDQRQRVAGDRRRAASLPFSVAAARDLQTRLPQAREARKSPNRDT